VAFDGGPGTDSLVGADTTNTWVVAGRDRGTVNGRTTFVGVEHLTGGRGGDTFKVGRGAGISGSLNGAAGADTVDYSAWIAAINVDLQAGRATGIGSAAGVVGRARGIENAIGGAGADRLVGSAGKNLLVGNGGNDTLYGAAGDDVLKGGSGVDRLYGETGRDVLDGGLDHKADVLAGGVGADMFVAEWYVVRGRRRNRDHPADATAAQRDTTR
jgi:Ca2+-binding RTX toxin-like protein